MFETTPNPIKALKHIAVMMQLKTGKPLSTIENRARAYPRSVEATI